MVIPVLLVLLISIVYGRTLFFGFVFDDHGYYANNGHVPSGLSRANFVWAFTTTYFSNWHPVTWLSLMLDAQIYGENAGGFHLTNLILHSINVVLLFNLLCRMTHSVPNSAIVAVLFAIHPLHVESVAWISERKGLLSTLFGLLAVTAYVRYVHSSRRTYYVLAMIAYALSLMSKQMLVTLPLLLLLLDFWPLQRTGVVLRRLLLEKIPFLVVTIVFCAVAFATQNQSGATAMLEASLVSRIFNAILVYVLYLAKTIWPMKMAAFYPHPRGDISLVAVSIAAIFLVFISVVVIVQRRSRPYLLMGWLWYLGTLVPVIGIVQVGGQQMADRYTYLPLVGIFIATSWLVSSIVPSTAWRTSVMPRLGLAGFILAMALVAYRQTGSWRSDITLFEHAASVTENNVLAHTQLGVVMEREKRFGSAMEHYRKALAIQPNDAIVHFSMANLLVQMRQDDEALQHYEKSLSINENYVDVHTNLGLLLERLGRFDEAIEHFRQAIALDPESVEAPYNWGNVLFKLGEYPEAITYYRAALKLDPERLEARSNLAFALYRLGRLDEAEQQCREVLRIDPNFAPAIRGLQLIDKKSSRK